MEYVIQRKVEHDFSTAVDPLASMQAIENPALAEIVGTVRAKLQQVIEAL